MNSRRLALLIVILLSPGSVAPAHAQTDSTTRDVFDSTSSTSTPEQPGPYYALVIGINDYQHLTKLNTALNDANEVGRMLHERYGFETTVLSNATRHDILSALDNLRRTLPDNGNLLIYYAGHGWYDHDMDKAYWAPAEAEKDTYADWIMADEITSRARAIPARHILIVSDSCYSGMIAANREDSPTMAPLKRGPYLDKCVRKKSRAVISSGGNEPVADAGAPGHSIFTGTFLRGLREIESDEFSANDLFQQYVVVQVAGNSNQVPTFRVVLNSGDDFGDFVFSRLPVAATAQPAGGGKAAIQPKALLAQAKALRASGDTQGSAYVLFKQAAEGGNAEAMTYVGLYYDSSRPAYAGVSKDDSVAATWYRKAAEAGDARGMTRLGWMYHGGRGVVQDDAQAVSWTRRAAEAGEAGGMNNLGVMYANGRGVAKDDAQAVDWYRKAAEAGEPVAMVNLGWMYANGRGVARDYAQAANWYRKAAEAGNARGMANLGWLCANGRGVAEDDAQGFSWTRRAAEAGDVLGMNNLAVMYADGKGVAKDDAEAVSWYRKAAEAGNALAMVNLGKRYGNGKGVTQDDAQAVNWYRKAAEAGEPKGMYDLGVMYANGKGVAKDDAQALSWYRKAAEAGDPPAMNNLGVMYANGTGVAKDDGQAMTWYRKAAEAGNALAMRQPREEVRERQWSA